MSRIAPIFWTIAALDAVAFAVMLVATLRSPAGHNDGGREMALFFYVMVPGAVLAITMLVFAFSSGPFVRVAALLVVALPGLFYVWLQLDDARIDRAVASQRSGAGYFSGESMRAMGVAVVNRDIATLQRVGPAVDINGIGKHDMTLLALAVDRRVDGRLSPSDADEVPVVRTLLALGARPDSALALTLKRPDPTLLRLLLDAGADANLRPPGEQAVVFAWYPVMPPESLKLLIAHGLDVDTRYYDEPIAVLFTIYRRWDLVDVLVAAGTDIDRPRPDGRNVRAELAAQMADALTERRDIPADLLHLAARLGVPQPAPAR